MAPTQVECVLHHVRKLIGIQRETDQADDELLGRFLAWRDESAFTTLVRRHGPLVQRVCRRVLGDDHAAEDAFQATFLVLARKAASIRKRRSLGGWLYEVAYHLAVRARADGARRSRHERQAVAMPRNQAPTEDREVLHTLVDEEVHRLPEKYRRPLVLCYLEGKTNLQAARELGWPPGSIALRLTRGREMLRDRLVGRGVALSAASLAALLTENAVPAAVPDAVVQNTVQAALLFAAGNTAAAGMVAAPAVLLAEGMLNTMISTKLKLVAALVVTVALLGTGTSVLIQSSVSAQAQAPAAAERKADRAAAAPEVSRADAFGDTLPENALARMGTLRWRHGGAVAFVGYSPDGRQLVTASADGFYRVWDTATGKEIRRFGKGQVVAAAPADREIKEADVKRAVFNEAGPGVLLAPDGQTLAVVSANGTVQLWPTATGNEPRTIEQKGLRSLAFTPDSKALATRSNDPAIRLWDVATGNEVRTLPLIRNDEPKPKDEGAEEKLSPQELERFAALLRFSGATVAANTMAFTPDGKAVVTLGLEGDERRGQVRVWNAETGRELHRLNAPTKFGLLGVGMALAADGKTVAWANGSGVIRLYETETGKELRQLGQPVEGPRGIKVYNTLAFSPDGKILAERSNEFQRGVTIRLWDVASGKELRQLGEPNNPPVGNPSLINAGGPSRIGAATIAFSPDGRLVAEGTPQHTVRLWEVASGKEVAPASGHQGGVSSLSVSPDARLLATHGADNTVRQWDIPSGKELNQFKLPAGARNVSFAADGKTIACAVNYKVHVFEVNGGKELAVIQLPVPGGLQRGAVIAAGPVLSPDGKAVAVRGSIDQVIRVFDLATNKETVAMVETEEGNVVEGGGDRRPVAVSPVLLFSPDSTMLATLSRPTAPRNESSTIILWSIARGKKLRQFDTAERGLQALAFSPDGRLIVSANRDQSVSLWESFTGKECLQLKLDASQAGRPADPKAELEKRIEEEAAVERPFLAPPAGGPLCIAIAANGRTLAVGGRDQTIRLFDMGTGAGLGRFTGHTGNILSVTFAPDSRTVISGSLDTTALVWDGGAFLKTDAPTSELSSQQVDRLWNDLAGTPNQAFTAIATLSVAPKQTVALCRERVKPAQGVEAKRLEQLVANLDSKVFATRQRATEDLDKLGGLAEPALKKMLATQPALETQQRIERLLDALLTGHIPSVDVLRNLRAVWVLEKVGTSEARQQLQTLAQGAPGDRLTNEAAIALKRLEK